MSVEESPGFSRGRGFNGEFESGIPVSRIPGTRGIRRAAGGENLMQDDLDPLLKERPYNARRMREPIIAVAHSEGQLDQWAQELIEYGHNLGLYILDIHGQDLTYERMTDILTLQKPAVLFNFGLGTETSLIGSDMRSMLTCGHDKYRPMTLVPKNNLNVLAGIAVIAYSSHAAKHFGSESIKAGSPAFVGFSKNLIVVSDDTGAQDLYKAALLPLAARILDGCEIGNTVDACRIDLKNVIKNYKDRKLISVPLFSNMKSLTLLGDPKWKLIINP